MEKHELTIHNGFTWEFAGRYESEESAESALFSEVARFPRFPAIVTYAGKLVRFWWPLKVIVT